MRWSIVLLSTFVVSNLKSNLFIRSFVSFLLICVFALGITPKKTIHQWLANHKDQASTNAARHETMIVVAGYHCNTDNLVTESPFNFSVEPYRLTTPLKIPVERGTIIPNFYSLHHFYSELRGPPVA